MIILIYRVKRKEWSGKQVVIDKESGVYSNFNANNTQLPRAVSEIKKMSKVYDYNPKFLHWSKVKMSPQSKFFNEPFLFKSNFKVFTL